MMSLKKWDHYTYLFATFCFHKYLREIPHLRYNSAVHLMFNSNNIIFMTP